jgi:selenocysteine lyase/cysteine desulfurase
VSQAEPRCDFPALEQLTYLNTASIGLVPRPVIQKAHQFEAAVAGQGTTALDEEAETAAFETARAEAARLLNAPVGSIAITNSFTEALCQVAWWLRPGPEANIVSIDGEFPSVVYPWHRIAEDTGMSLRLAPLPGAGRSLDPGQLARLMDASTKALCVSHVQYLTGHRLDLAGLAAAAHAHNAIVIVDASQSAGQVPLDVTESGVDVLIAGGYKFLCGTFGAAICYISPELLADFRPPFVGWRSTVDPFGFKSAYKPMADSARRMEFSTASYSAAVALGAACGYINGLDPAKIFEHNTLLASRLMHGLERLGATVLTPEPPSDRAGIVTARFTDHDGSQIVDELKARDVIVSARGDCTRFSVHFYNTTDDVDRALTVLAEIMADRGNSPRGSNAL